MTRARTGQATKTAGFSVLEMLIVLVLLAIVVGVTGPALARFMDNLAFRRQGHQVKAALRYARLQAITKGQDVSVTQDEENPNVLRFAGQVTESSREIELDEDGGSLSLEPPVISFFLEGYATPATLTLTGKHRRQKIVIEPLTGLPVDAAE